MIGGIMILFLMSLMVMRFRSDIPCKAGGKPKQKPPDIDHSTSPIPYETAYYWDMYGAMENAKPT